VSNRPGPADARKQKRISDNASMQMTLKPESGHGRDGDLIGSPITRPGRSLNRYSFRMCLPCYQSTCPEGHHQMPASHVSSVSGNRCDRMA
jgi:hypothetical protein